MTPDIFGTLVYLDPTRIQIIFEGQIRRWTFTVTC